MVQSSSLNLSSDGRFALMNMSSKTKCQVQLWDLQGLEVVHSYSGHVHHRFALRSCFGGPLQNFVASGSEGPVFRLLKEEEGPEERAQGHG